MRTNAPRRILLKKLPNFDGGVGVEFAVSGSMSAKVARVSMEASQLRPDFCKRNSLRLAPVSSDFVLPER